VRDVGRGDRPLAVGHRRGLLIRVLGLTVLATSKIDLWTIIKYVLSNRHNRPFLNFFFGVPHLATCIFLFFYNEPELGVGIDPGLALTPLPSSIGQGLNP
jgi:hypothetical protein